ncbi:MAG: UDP-glucose 4-epimerase GalE [Ferruginibacter sp.]|nr:UDP-glucose 4-epimerase GalE [Ferruginibacter sp.]
MKTIIVTGGCGYIGSHTLVDLIENGYHVISIDNNSRSNADILKGVKKITGVDVKNYKVNLCNFDETHAIFQENENISGIIHFAAYKAVSESVENPLAYYDNNVNSLINILRCATEFKVPHFVFSSSCTVYGNPDIIPVTEESPFLTAASPYGATKQMGEEIVRDTVKSCINLEAVLLRYFNPVGAHPSIAIGELPIGKPQNLVPAITQTAIGKLLQMKVWGSDYDTKDGTCVRDFIHVCDIAHAHTLAIKNLENKTNKTNCDVFNLGTGNGYSVLEVIKTFEKVSGILLNYTLSNRREGDVIAIYANNDKAKNELHWHTKFDLDDMMLSAWEWEKSMSKV